MRQVADAERIRRFMQEFGAAAEVATRVYFTGGATAVLLGWRTSTIDVDIKMEPDSDAMFRAIPRLKESLQLNVELASPVDFIPVRPGWEDRSPFVAQEGRAAFIISIRTRKRSQRSSAGIIRTFSTCAKCSRAAW